MVGYGQETNVNKIEQLNEQLYDQVLSGNIGPFAAVGEGVAYLDTST